MSDKVEVLDLTKPIAEQLAGKKVRIDSVEHLDYVMSITSSNLDRDELVERIKLGLYVCFSKDKSKLSEQQFDYGLLSHKTIAESEIKIPLPSIESRILAEKVSDRGMTVNVEFYRPESTDSQVGDMVKKPNHYQLLPEYEVKDVNKALLDKIQASDFDMSLYEAGWYQQAMQYFMRFYAKNGLEDLEKGIETMQFAVDSLKQRAAEDEMIQDIAKHDIVYK